MMVFSSTLVSLIPSSRTFMKCILTVGELSLELQNLRDLQVAATVSVNVLEHLVQLVNKHLLICRCHVSIQIGE
jgi:hypothetical protein